MPKYTQQLLDRVRAGDFSAFQGLQDYINKQHDNPPTAEKRIPWNVIELLQTDLNLNDLGLLQAYENNTLENPALITDDVLQVNVGTFFSAAKIVFTFQKLKTDLSQPINSSKSGDLEPISKLIDKHSRAVKSLDIQVNEQHQLIVKFSAEFGITLDELKKYQKVLEQLVPLHPEASHPQKMLALSNRVIHASENISEYDNQQLCDLQQDIEELTTGAEPKVQSIFSKISHYISELFFKYTSPKQYKAELTAKAATQSFHQFKESYQREYDADDSTPASRDENGSGSTPESAA